VNFRLRCRFAITVNAETNKLQYTLWDEGEPKVHYRDHFPIASKQINVLMPLLLDNVESQPELRSGLEAVHFLTTLAGQDVAITLVYNCRIESAWRREADAIAKSLNVSIIGRSRGVRIVCGRDHVVERMVLSDGREFAWKQVEGAFSNPNGHICKSTIEWICELVQSKINRGSSSSNKSLLDLYCGNGNYTVPLSKFYKNVLSVELSDALVKIAKHNFQLNSVKNVSIVKSDCRKFSALLQKKWVTEWYDFSTVLVDPPRAGLDQNTLEVVSRFENVIYISCNVDTLRSCLATLVHTHNVESVRVFDHFPYTEGHAECVAFLQKKAMGNGVLRFLRNLLGRGSGRPGLGQS